MRNPKSILGALFLSALCFCVFGVANASALTVHECKKTEGKGTSRFTDSGCVTPNAAGEFETVPLVGSNEVVPTLTPTTGTTETHAVLEGTIAGAEYEITCTGLTSANAKLENGTAGTEMFVKGSGIVEFTGCKVNKPAGVGCTVPATLETEELNSTTKEMTVTFKPTNAEEKIITFTISGCTGGAKVLNGSKTFKGTLAATLLAEKPTSLEFNETSGSKLTFGGQAANFTAVIHFATKANGALLSFETP